MVASELIFYYFSFHFRTKCKTSFQINPIESFKFVFDEFSLARPSMKNLSPCERPKGVLNAIDVIIRDIDFHLLDVIFLYDLSGISVFPKNIAVYVVDGHFFPFWYPFSSLFSRFKGGRERGRVGKSSVFSHVHRRESRNGPIEISTYFWSDVLLVSEHQLKDRIDFR